MQPLDHHVAAGGQDPCLFSMGLGASGSQEVAGAVQVQHGPERLVAKGKGRRIGQDPLARNPLQDVPTDVQGHYVMARSQQRGLGLAVADTEFQHASGARLR